MSWRATDNRFLFIFGNIDTESVASTDTFPPGTFYHVAATYDGSVFRLFVNGVPEGSFSETKTVAYSASGWVFGSIAPAILTQPGNFKRTWNGVIDEIQAFNRPLPASELQSIYNAASAGECKTPAITPGGVVSASAFGEFSSASPGSWVEIYGANLAADARSWTTADFTGINAPTALDGTTVTIAGQQAFLSYISPGQVNALIPSNVPTGTQQITLATATGASAVYTITLNATEAGFLSPSSFNIGSVQYITAFIYPDEAFALPAGAMPGANSRPAVPGDVLTLYGIGFGPVMPSTPAGQLVQATNNLALPFQVSVGGVPATVQYAGLAPTYTGLYQFNITVPNVPAGNQPLTFTLKGAPGTQTLYLSVGQ
jgi:uncharacterized protein (TIGR03437 family)